MSETQASASQGLLIETTKMDAEDVRAVNIDLKQENVDTSECRPTIKSEKAESSELNDVFQTGNVLSEDQLSPTQILGLETIKKDAEEVDVAVEQQNMDISYCEPTIKQEDIKITEDFEKEQRLPENNGCPLESIKNEAVNLDGTIEEEIDISACEVHENVHMIVDKGELFKCKTCTFETRYKASLRRHSKRHLNVDEAELFKCESCDFQTNVKRYLTDHLKRHFNVDEVELHKCAICNFQTRYKANLLRHSKWHLNLGEVKLYKCETCDFQTKRKQNLGQHSKRHLNLNKVSNCEKCDFQTKHKSNLKIHSQRHLSLDQVKFFKCESCDYQTRYKQKIQNHQKRHLIELP